MQSLDKEWRGHALLDPKNLSYTEDAECYWREISKMKNVGGIILFPNLKKLYPFFLFCHFQMHPLRECSVHIKSDVRNRLSTDSVSKSPYGD